MLLATTNTASMTTTTAKTIKRKKENEKNFLYIYTSKLINCEEIVARDVTMSYGKEEEIF